LRWELAQRKARKNREAAETRERAILEAEEKIRAHKALLEHVQRGPCTYDWDGNVIWIEEPDVDRLPTYIRDPIEYAVDSGLQEFPSVSSSASRRSRKAQAKPGARPAHRKPEKHSATKFTDSWSKPIGWQPPIWETFRANKGVTLECGGHVVEGGAEDTGRRMTRKEFLQICEGELSFEFGAAGASIMRASEAHSRSLQEPSAVLAASAAQGRRASLAATLERPHCSDTSVQQSQQTQPHAGGGQEAQVVGGHSTEEASRSQAPAAQAPAAPNWQLRASRSQVSLNGRSSRCRMPSLGGPRGIGPAQPVLGATMGHGLLRDATTKAQFFFPSDKAQTQASNSRPPTATGTRRRPASSTGGRAASAGAMRRPQSAAALGSAAMTR